jgi:hypothetical protein
LSFLAEAGCPDALDVDAIPHFLDGKTAHRIIVTTAGSQHRNTVTCLSKANGEIREMLRCGNRVGIKALIDQ